MKKLKKKEKKEVFPKDVDLIKELNERYKKEYLEWLRKKIATEETLARATLIIGVKGEDGIVFGGDTKVMRGGEADFEHKVRTLKIRDIPVMFAAAGVVGVIEDFLELFEETIRGLIDRGRADSIRSIKLIAEDLVKSVAERYAPRVGKAPIRFLFGGLSKLNEGKARLYEVNYLGFGTKVKYCSLIGHGSTYARTIGKYLLPRGNKTTSLKVDKIIPRVAACIHWIGSGIDMYVGGKPQIVYMSDGNPEIVEAKYDYREVKKKVKEFKEILEKKSF